MNIAVLNIVLVFVLFIVIAIFCYYVKKYYHHNKINTILRKELDKALEEIIELNLKQKNKSSFANIRTNTGALDDVEILSTLLTVVISKYGTAILSAQDFNALKDDDYVSMYANSKTNEIILSMDGNLENKSMMYAANYFSNHEDDTFH